MSQSTAAKRYAQALFELAQEKQLLTEVEADLREIKTVFHENKELLQVLASPNLSLSSKKQMIQDVFAGANEIVMSTLQLLVDKKRINETVQVIEEFMKLSHEALGVAEAKVYSTRALTDEECEKISTAFAQKVGKQSLRIQNEIDPSLIGGIRLQIGNRIYDSSILNKLNRLQRELIG